MAFGVTIFSSAFLLFQVQPVIAKYILPWYGGSPAVWTTCLLFFQAGLLVGYSYAYLLVNYLCKSKQVIVHVTLLTLSLFLLPVTPDPSFKPAGLEDPLFGIIKLLFSTVGIPYLFVSTTGPLLQHWYGMRHPGQSPYRLYALSNVGSLLGLLSYPFVFEPALTLTTQTLFWSGAYALFIASSIWCGMLMKGGARNASNTGPSATEESPSADAATSRWFDPILWMFLSASGSMMLLSSTNMITQDVAVVPFLWVLPLALYLISFIIAFDSPRWYRRWIWVPLFLISIPGCILLLNQAHGVDEMHLKTQVLIYAIGMFAAVMICHGEMVRIKPKLGKLTAFYLLISLGGALGGVFVNLVAPLLFNGFWEYHISILAVLVVAVIGFFRSPWASRRRLRFYLGAFTSVITLGITTFFLWKHIEDYQENIVAASRSFYGVLRVYDDDIGDSNQRRKLYHGRINHGQEWADPEKRDRPTSYYSRHSGVGIALRRHPIKQAARDGISEEGIKVGVIGLGVGTIASYARPQDRFVYYEINPAVESVAREHFHFLSDAESDIEVVIGDGRISLEHELKEEGPREFDILAVDAFSGDAIPIHLLTKEAFDLYFKHLKEDGILCLHISNLHINLRPVVRTLADHFEKRSILIKNSSDSSELIKSSSWVLVTNNETFLSHDRVAHYVRDWDERDLIDTLWTDDYSSIATVFKK